MKSTLSFKHSYTSTDTLTKDNVHDPRAWKFNAKVMRREINGWHLGNIEETVDGYKFVARRSESPEVGYNPLYPEDVLLSTDELSDVQEYIATIPELWNEPGRKEGRESILKMTSITHWGM